MLWKNLLRLVLITLLPIFYGMIKGKYPDFPLSQAMLIDLILWGVALLIGGWQALQLIVHYVKNGSLR